MQALQTVGRGSTASTKIVSWAMDSRSRPMTSKHKSRGAGKTLKSSGEKSGTVEEAGNKTSDEKTGKGAARNASKQSSRKAQARDACGRFVKTEVKKTKVEMELEKLWKKQLKLKIKIDELAKTAEEDVATRHEAQGEIEVKMLKKVARDFEWLGKMVRKLKEKLEAGTRSQKVWAKKALPKYRARLSLAEEAQVRLKTKDAESSDDEKYEACWNKDMTQRGVSQRGQVGAVDLQARLQEAKKKMKAREDAKAELHDELSYWKNRAGVWQAQCENLKSQVESLMSEKQEAEAARFEVEEEAEALAKKVGRLKQKLKNHREIADENDVTMMELVQENDELREQLKRAQCAKGNGNSRRK